MPRRIPIRLKLAAALAVPICALLIVSVLEVTQSARQVSDTRDQTELATAAVGPGGLITALQNERNYGTVYILGFEGALQLPVTSYDEAMTATDAAIAEFRADVEAKGGAVSRTYSPALRAVSEQIGALREIVTGYDGPRNQEMTDVSDPFFMGVTELIDELFRANAQVPLSIDDPTLRRGVELTDLATHQIENVARLTRVVLLAGVGGGLDQPDEIAETAGLVGQVEANLDQTRDLGIGRYRPATEKAIDEFTSSGYLDYVQQAVDTGEVQLTEMMGSLSREDDEGFNGMRAAIDRELLNRADELNANAAATQRRYIALALAAVVVAGLVTWLVSRSITQPLRSLTHQAKEMAEHRLPEAVTDILETPLGEDVTVPTVDPVRVDTRDEVSDVADALNTVQDSALDLAVEQAVLRRNIADSFVNLGRRNQNLLGRQLDFITELESNETNADTLSNLFRLDHLATRMRRNAESLLVLAGIEPPRQWAAPVRLTDVIRAALGEVEDYQRVTVRGVEPATIIGSAAADLAHLLAELIENALVFSPPDQTVDIRGRNRPDGYTLAIIDSGLGMPAADVEAANRRLAGMESFTIAPSKYLGHYVAGNLAARHGIGVRLDNSPGNGITATILVPPSLLTDEAVTSAPITPPGGHRLPAAGPHAVPAAPVLPAAAPAGGGQPAATAPPRPPAAPSPPAPLWPPAPAPAAPAAHLDRRGPAPSGIAAPPVRPGGLARRVPATPAAPAPPERGPAPADDQALLSALGRYAPGTGPAGGGPARHSGATPAAGGAAGRDPLTRRVKGAQLPPTSVVPLHNGHGGTGRAGRPAPASARPSAQSFDRATDVQRLLTSFTIGVQRGLAEARRPPH